MFENEITHAYEQVSGKWTGCDWRTQFGDRGLDLNGLKSRQAYLMSRATSGTESADWRKAAHWLARVEKLARIAKNNARLALKLAGHERWKEALARAELALAVEARFHTNPAWKPFRDAIARNMKNGR